MLIYIFIILSLASCTNTPVVVRPVDPSHRVALSWENTTEPHPERAAWSDFLFGQIGMDFQSLNKAKDFRTFCPDYNNISLDNKQKAWAEMFVATAYYESGWDVASESVDVGNKNDRDTWSVGLLQLSVTDQVNYGLEFGYKYRDLLSPVQNLNLGLAIMKQQIVNRGLVIVPNRPYWAVLYRGRYDKIESIASRVKKNVPECAL